MKYIFLDVDGTIVDHKNKVIPSNTIKTLKTLLKNGHKIFIASGRPEIISHLDLDVEFSGYIASTGTHVTYMNETIIDEPFDKQTLDRLIEVAKKYDVEVSLEGKINGYGDNMLYHRVYDDIRNTVAFQGNYHYWLSVEDYKDETIYKLTCETSVENKNNFELFIKEISSFASPYFTGINHVSSEVSLLNHSKGYGIKALIDKGIVKKENTICVGDSGNDISMFEVCEISICMGQANENVKEKAKIVTDSVDNDGFYKAFKNLGLLEE